ncbi:aldehyde dehydrogenase family protein [Pseudoxanthomonas winnipegensis]|nr:aldehyde dehydrogenase family protein [Pseudoxanthomonas winnipegensis]
MYDKIELERVLHAQRADLLREGDASLPARRDRVSRMALALLENIDALADTLSADYGWRPAPVSKAFDALSWVHDIEQTLDHLEQWMAPRTVLGGFVQAKPKGVVGIMGAWNFPLALTFQPAMAALAAGNRVMLNFPEQHPRTGALLREIFSARFDEREVALFNGDLGTAQHFSTLRFDHLFFTGSPEVGALVAQATAKNLVPATLELGGKNPVVVARDADLALAATRITSSRLLNGGQVCLCPDYVLVPEERFEEFVGHLEARFRAVTGDWLHNPAIVPLVNERNYDRVLALIDDALAQGAQKIEPLPEHQLRQLPDRASRRIAPTLLIDVPEGAQVNAHEVFGPVLVLMPYAEIGQAIDYIARRPAPLAAYWYGEDGADFRQFLCRTTSGGVARNDGFVHAMLPDAPFGGVGNSGSGAYHGRAGFDTFTHYRTVANGAGPRGAADAFVDGTMLQEAAHAGLDGAIAAAIDGFRKRAGL